MTLALVSCYLSGGETPNNSGGSGRKGDKFRALKAAEEERKAAEAAAKQQAAPGNGATVRFRSSTSCLL